MPDMLSTFEDRLIDLLCSIPNLKYRENRNILLRNLPKEPILTMPSSDTPLGYFNNLVDCAKDWGWIDSQKKFALEIIMDNVKRFFVTETGLELKLNTLIEEFQQSDELRQINVRVVVVAMTRKEAQELAPEAIKDLKAALQEYLKKCEVADFTLCYEDDEKNRDDWKPLAAEKKSIRLIVQDVVDRINERSAKNLGQLPIHPQYLSTTFLSRDPEERRRARATLQELGGILIVDAISMYHPRLKDILLQSQLMSPNNPIAMVVVSPIKSSALEVNELLKTQIYDSHLETPFGFFVYDLDPFYEFGVGDVNKLRRWLSSTLPNVHNRRGLSQEMRNAIRDAAGITSGGGVGIRVIGGVRQ